MAATVTKESFPSQQQQGPSSSSSTAAEDESMKRNTDCVYFLASPLTCKKGSECEYRHSEYARVNPRDCWYWLNGNCLNPKCSFRHPPLDGLVGAEAGNFAGPPALVPPAPLVPVPVPAASQNSTKQGVPCIFFQKGYCLKGDRCPFMHGPNPTSTKIQVPDSTNAPEAAAFKKTFGGLEKVTRPKINFHSNTPKVVEAPPKANASPKVQLARPTNGEPVGRGYPPRSGVIGEAPKYEVIKPSSIDNGNSRSRTGRALHGGSSDDQNFPNGRDADDSLRESSPGFDVLVDDKVSEDEYYQEDRYARMRSLDGRNMIDFDLGRQDDYNSVADVDPEIYHSRRGYDSYDRLPEKHAWDHRRASSERSLGEPAHYDRRGVYKSQSPDPNQKSDLRHRLSKPRRVNGLKSVVNPDYGLDDHAEDRGYRSSRRESRRSPVHESSRGHRLQGRIKLPRPSPLNGNDMYSERGNERGRNRGRLSPSRQQVSGQQGRLRDRLAGRIQDESHEGRKIQAPVMRKDTIQANGIDFAGPKRLSELKGTKQTENKQQQSKSQQSISGGKLRDTVLASSLGTEGDLSFEGPRPLSEILKRKRTTSTGTNSDNKEEIKQNKNDVNLMSSASSAATDTGKQVAHSSSAELGKASEEENKPPTVEHDEEEGEISNKKIKLNGEGESSLPNANKHPEAEALVAADGEEHEFDEEYDQGDGEYEYEQDDGVGYHLNEGEIGDHVEDYMEDDDADDFAKTLGVSF